MQLTPHLHFNGRCQEAFLHYAQCLGGKIVTRLTHAASPMADQVPAEWGGKILHATLSFGDQELTGCDVPHSVCWWTATESPGWLTAARPPEHLLNVKKVCLGCRFQAQQFD